MIARASLTVAMLACLAGPSVAEAGLIGDFPDIILCSTKNGTVVGRLQGVEDGTARYMDLSNRVVTIGPDLIVRRENSPDCNGKTVAELRAEGRAFDLVTR